MGSGPVAEKNPMRHGDVALGTLLDRMDPGEESDQLVFFRALNAAGPSGVEDLAPRVLRAGCPSGLRSLVVEAACYLPWPEWLPVLARLLRHETDLGRFALGVEALGRMGHEEALAVLQELARIRGAADFQAQVVEVLARTDPDQAFRHHLAALLEGSASPGAANEAARQLSLLLKPEHLETLRLAVRHPDLLISRHALKLIQGIPSPEAAAFLLGLLAETLEEIRQDRRLRDLTQQFRGLPPADLRGAVLERLAEPLGELSAEARSRLEEGSGAPALAVLDPLEALLQGPVDRLLLDLLRAILDPKGGRPGVVLGEAMEGVQQRARRLVFVVDACAEGLSGMVQRGFFLAEEVVPLLASGVQEQLGREGLARALATLVSSEEEATWRLLLEQGDAALRAAAVDALGERRDPAFRPALLRACRDAISEVAQRALLHLGTLPDPEAQAREFLASPNLEDRYLGLRFVGIHRLQGLGQDLLALVEAGGREEFTLAVLQALAALGNRDLAPNLLELLHSGQGARLQEAIAETLRDLADPSLALTLCEKADQLRQPILHAIALESMVRSHAGAGMGVDEEAFTVLLAQVQGAWAGRNPWALRLRVVEALVVCPGGAPGGWRSLVAMIQDALAERRPGSSSGWSTEAAGRVQMMLRELQKRV